MKARTDDDPMPSCTISVEGGVFVALLSGVETAPDTSWERGPDHGTFTRQLSAGEAYEVGGCAGRLPELQKEVEYKLSSSVRELRFGRRAMTIGIVAEKRPNELVLQVVLARFSRPDLSLKAPDSIWKQPKQGYVISESQWLAYDIEALQRIRGVLEGANIDLATASPWRVSPRQFRDVRAAAISAELLFHGEDALQEHLASLERQLPDARLDLPKNLKVNLYPYQEEALRWLQFCRDHGVGCLLADDMGLGKTGTLIALVASSQNGRPSLVVAPATLLANWLREIERFCPALRAGLHHGSSRNLTPSSLGEYDVIVTSYATMRNDVALLTRVSWNIIALDEAQRVKNPEAGVASAVRQLKARCPVALTGTPFENRPMDLWSLMEFIQPGFLGTSSEFEETYSRRILNGDHVALEDLKSSIKLFMMRRLKRDVRKQLPEKIEVEQPILMTRSEAREYSNLAQELRRNAKDKGISTQLVTPLRQLCCHPRLLDDMWYGDPVVECGKYQLLVNILANVVACGEKAIIFTSYRLMLDLLERDLPKRFGVPAYRIDGAVSICERQPKVDEFTSVAGPALMLLNPQAAGVGLNIVAANHIIHYNREWNPAVEDQASDRAYRIGQERSVTVHYLYYLQTIDELITQRLSQKRQLAAGLVTPTADKDEDRNAVLAALDLRPTWVLEDADEDPY